MFFFHSTYTHCCFFFCTIHQTKFNAMCIYWNASSVMVTQKQHNPKNRSYVIPFSVPKTVCILVVCERTEPMNRNCFFSLFLCSLFCFSFWGKPKDKWWNRIKREKREMMCILNCLLSKSGQENDESKRTKEEWSYCKYIALPCKVIHGTM